MPDTQERITAALRTILEKSELSERYLHAHVEDGTANFDTASPGIFIKVAHTSQPGSIYNPSQMIFVSKRLKQIARQVNEYLEIPNAVKVESDYGYDELKHLPSQARKPANALVVDTLVLSDPKRLTELESLAQNFVLNETGIYYETALESPKGKGR